jgi:hypothetical protein
MVFNKSNNDSLLNFPIRILVKQKEFDEGDVYKFDVVLVSINCMYVYQLEMTFCKNEE